MGKALNEPKTFRAIMLSSTFTDLREHRQKAIEAIQKLGYVPRVMEFSGAQAAADVIDASLEMVRDAVGYVLVIGRKYGQTPFDPDRNPNRLSITELEFNEALRLGRPILLFIMDSKHPIIEADVELDPDKRKKLEAFRERAKQMRTGGEVHRVYEPFGDLSRFSHAAAIAIGGLIQQLNKDDAVNPSTAAAAVEQHTVRASTISNIPINIPRHFLGRDDDLAAIDTALKTSNGRAAITALHGLRGVGKSTLAAAYAEQHRGDYRATWWIRAETEPTMRADLVGLGVRLGWVAPDAPEEAALATVLEQLCQGIDGVVLIYDNAISPGSLDKFLPRGGGPRIIVTSNAPNWGGVASPVEIEVWPSDVGADFLTARTGRRTERGAALLLSEALGGLPLAHEQAAAYCERIGVSLAEYRSRFEKTPLVLLGNTRDASKAYHDGLTVEKTFALAIAEAAKLHPAAELLITYAAMLAPEPIPLYLFSEGREKFGEPFGSLLEDEGSLDEAVAALRAFALIDRETIPDERYSEVTADCIRLHRLVREVAAGRSTVDAAIARGALIRAMASAYPAEVFNDPFSWFRARRLDPLARALVSPESDLPKGSELSTSFLLNQMANYRQRALAAFGEARNLFERALTIDEHMLGPEHSDTAASLNNLGLLLQEQGDLAGARPYYERSLAITEKVLGPDHPYTATNLNNLGLLAQAQGDLPGAWPYFERAIAISEKALGPEHPDTAKSLSNFGRLLHAKGDLAGARSYYERAHAIREKMLAPDHLDTAMTLNNLGGLLQAQGDLAGARPYCERALAIREKALGPEHPDTAVSLNNLGYLLRAQGDLAGARPYYERSVAICEKSLGVAHPTSQLIARNAIDLLEDLGLQGEADELRRRFGIEGT